MYRCINVSIIYMLLFQVGGAFSNAVINHMNDYGRMSICGNITDYNAQKHTEG